MAKATVGDVFTLDELLYIHKSSILISPNKEVQDLTFTELKAIGSSILCQDAIDNDVTFMEAAVDYIVRQCSIRNLSIF